MSAAAVAWLTVILVVVMALVAATIAGRRAGRNEVRKSAAEDALKVKDAQLKARRADSVGDLARRVREDGGA